MTQCTRYWKENVDVHTCTPLPTAPEGADRRDILQELLEARDNLDRDDYVEKIKEIVYRLPTPKSQEAVAGKKYSTWDIAHFVIDHKLQKRNAWAALWFFLEYNNMLAD